MAYPNDGWQRKGATLSDKTARQEFGLTQDEIYDAIDAGTLQYRQAYMHGNPWLRLLRRVVEALARARHGDRYVSDQQARAELTRVNREIGRLRTELAELEERRAKLSSDLGEVTPLRLVEHSETREHLGCGEVLGHDRLAVGQPLHRPAAQRRDLRTFRNRAEGVKQAPAC